MMTFLFAAILGIGFAVSVSAMENVCTCKQGLASSTLVCSLGDPNDHLTITEDYCNNRISAVSLKLLRHSYLSSSVIPSINLFRIKITGENLKEVFEDAFVGHEATLQFVEIVKGSLIEIPTSALKGLRHLQSLNLATNAIGYINCSLENAPLMQLILLDNQISSVHRCAFPLGLRSLSLKNNLVETLNGSLKDHNQLEQIFMKRNKLTSLEGQLEGLDSLAWLDASWNKIETIGTAPVKLHGLSSLDLSHNRISALGNSLTRFINLHYLDLSYNNLETLGEETFTNLTNLRHLSLSANDIRYVDDEAFLYLRNLETLVISENAISSLDAKLHALHSLKKLDASWNYIRGFRMAVVPLFSIEELNLSHNRIVDFGESEDRFTHLERLDLSYNDLEIITPHTFDMFSNIRALNLSGNKFNSLDGSMFTSLTKLKNLDLSFTGLQSLEDLMTPGFMGMQIGSASENSLEGWIQGKCVCRTRDVMKILRIEGNFLACFINYTELVTQMDQHNIEVTGC